MLRTKPGIWSCSVFLLGFSAVVYYKGPKLKDEYMRYALAGTSALVIVELATHTIDTLNMRSKMLKKESIKQQLTGNLLRYKATEMLQLFRGINAVVYGYVFSSIVYFYSYASLKNYFYTGAWPGAI